MTPVQIFEDEATEERAENARLVRLRANGEGGKRKGTDMTAISGRVGGGPRCQSLFVGAIAIGDLVKSTLGPKGMVLNGA